MSAYEVPKAMLNSPFAEPVEHWRIVEGEAPARVAGRRLPVYYYHPPVGPTEEAGSQGAGTAIELKLVSRMRERLSAWRSEGWPGVSRTTLELLRYWRRDGRQQRLFFAQLEAAKTIVFLVEARATSSRGSRSRRTTPATSAAPRDSRPSDATPPSPRRTRSRSASRG